MSDWTNRRRKDAAVGFQQIPIETTGAERRETAYIGDGARRHLSDCAAIEDDTKRLLAIFMERRTTLVESAAAIVGCPAHAEDIVQEAFSRPAASFS